MSFALLSFIGAAAAIVLGGFLGGGRALYRMARGRPISSVYDEEFIHLDLAEKWDERAKIVEVIEVIDEPHRKG